MGREYKNIAASGEPFIGFLRKNFISLDPGKESAIIDGNRSGVNKNTKGFGGDSQDRSNSLAKVLPLLEDKKNEEDFDISEKLTAGWLNDHLEEKKNLTSGINNKTKKKSELSRTKLVIDNLKITGHNLKSPYSLSGIKAGKLIYILLAILILSSIFAFQKRSSSMLIGFFDSLLLAPIKAFSANSEFYHASIDERSNYIKLNHQELSSRYAHGETGININSKDLKGKVAGAYEDNSIKEKKAFSEVIDKMIRKQKDLSLLLGEKISDWIKNN
jgi:hypothetical protein